MLAMNIKQEQTIREVVQRFKAALSGFPESVRKRGGEIDEAYFVHAISKAASQYARNYIKSYAFTQIFGSQKLTTLSSIYIGQKFQAYTSVRSFESVNDLEEAFAHDLQRSNYSKGNNLLGLNIANEEVYLMILGKPTAGKTTFLKYIGLEALYYPESRYKHDVLPVFIHLWKFCLNTDNLLQAIAEEFEKCGFPESRELTIWMLEQGNLLILVDGLNESTLSQRYLSQHLKEFVKAYPHNRYIVSSRLVSYQRNLGQFLELEMQTWDDLHIQEYIHKWFTINYESRANRDVNGTSNDSSKLADIASQEAQRCWQILQLNTVARDLANSPLSLAFLCLLCDRRLSLPSNVSGLYQKAINLVLEEQVLNYQLLNDQGQNIISTDILEILLTEIAYKSFELCQSLLPFQDLTEYLQEILTSYIGVLEKVEVSFNLLKVLQKIGICKINTVAGLTSFTFSHITFQEYFVARYIYNHNLVKQIVPQHLSDRRWQNIFLLLAGIANGNVEELLLSMEIQAASYINTNKLSDILEWIEQITIHSRGTQKSVAKRIAAMFLARPRFLAEIAPALVLTRMLELARELYGAFDLSPNFDKVFASDLSLSLAQALDFDSNTELNLVIQLCNDLEQTLVKIDFDKRYINFMALSARLESLIDQVPSYDQPFEVREDFRNQISRVWIQTLYLPVELNQISHHEVESLENYLYANLLMVKCKNIAIAVSRKVWEEIESRILRITGI